MGPSVPWQQTSLPAIMSGLLVLLMIAIALSRSGAHRMLGIDGQSGALFGRRGPQWQHSSPYSTGCSDCRFGTEPGSFNISRALGNRWQLASSRCQLHNYVDEFVRDAKTNSTPSKRASIFFLSDSNDYYVVKSFCDASGGKMTTTSNISYHRVHHGLNWCNSTNSGLVLRQVYMPTFTSRDAIYLDKDYTGHQGIPYLGGSKPKTLLARVSWEREFPDKEPDAVVLAGGLWDIFRWIASPPHSLHKLELTYRELNQSVSDELQRWWMTEVRATIRHVRTMFPRSQLIWRSYALPAWDLTSGKAISSHLGNKHTLVKIKAAGLAAAAEEGLDLVDVEPLVEAFAAPANYLFDATHPVPEVRFEELNLILNILMRPKCPK